MKVLYKRTIINVPDGMHLVIYESNFLKYLAKYMCIDEQSHTLKTWKIINPGHHTVFCSAVQNISPVSFDAKPNEITVVTLNSQFFPNNRFLRMLSIIFLTGVLHLKSCTSREDLKKLGIVTLQTQ